MMSQLLLIFRNLFIIAFVSVSCVVSFSSSPVNAHEIDLNGLLSRVYWGKEDQIEFEVKGPVYLLGNILKYSLRKQRVIFNANPDYKGNRRYFSEPTGKRTIYFDNGTDSLYIYEENKLLIKEKLGFYSPNLEPFYAVRRPRIARYLTYPVVNNEK